MAKPRLLILSVKAGAGHLRAAQALEQACREDHPDVEVRHLDALEYTNPAFRKAFTSAYETLAKELPSIWGMIYESMEEKRPRSKTQQLAQVFDQLNARPLWQEVKKYDPDSIICTHYMPAEVLCPRRKKGKLRAPVHIVLTDYDIHTMWMQEHADAYFVATPDMAYALQTKGIGDGATVSVSGIPVLPEFAAKYPAKPALREKLGLHPDRPTVLLCAGGFGLIQIDATVLELAEQLPDAQFIAIAGKSEPLQKKLDKAAKKHPDRIFPYGFVNNMHEFMAASDLAVTKCGGLTSSECLALGLPMVIVRPIPGQEERNADYLLESGVAVRANSAAHTIFKVQALLNDLPRLNRMREAALRIAKPRAARDIVDQALQALGVVTR